MGVILDTSIWVEVERGRLTPADVEAVIGKEPVYLSPLLLRSWNTACNAHRTTAVG